ncbi:hypothetical protein FHL15_003206 [Xylaria flabelliformis]|uniref:Uncharacterized protein n=1 Tax=Xylaria flabelliformis TaxID=2512241 RepID=A0A553I7A6_9PEZI|nr:hypothetical protein FHL15_003206 [Xylaria flabelliformis]
MEIRGKNKSLPDAVKANHVAGSLVGMSCRRQVGGVLIASREVIAGVDLPCFIMRHLVVEKMVMSDDYLGRRGSGGGLGACISSVDTAVFFGRRMVSGVVLCLARDGHKEKKKRNTCTEENVSNGHVRDTCISAEQEDRL